MQALIIGIAINVTSKDEMAIGKSLQESFRLAKEDNARHVKIWAATQFDVSTNYYLLYAPRYIVEIYMIGIVEVVCL